MLLSLEDYYVPIRSGHDSTELETVHVIGTGTHTWLMKSTAKYF